MCFSNGDASSCSSVGYAGKKLRDTGIIAQIGECPDTSPEADLAGGVSSSSDQSRALSDCISAASTKEDDGRDVVAGFGNGSASDDRRGRATLQSLSRLGLQEEVEQQELWEIRTYDGEDEIGNMFSVSSAQWSWSADRDSLRAFPMVTMTWPSASESAHHELATQSGRKACLQCGAGSVEACARFCTQCGTALCRAKISQR